jgi:hypothetical protein
MPLKQVLKDQNDSESPGAMDHHLIPPASAQVNRTCTADSSTRAHIPPRLKKPFGRAIGTCRCGTSP